MILRKPVLQDIYKATQLLSKDEEEQKLILQEWLYQIRNEPRFFSYVIVKDHDVLAVITGVFNVEECALKVGRFEGKEQLKQILFNKIVNNFDPESIAYSVDEVDKFVLDNNFQIQRYILLWSKPSETDVEVFDENNQST